MIKVCCFDEENENDLTDSINYFLSKLDDLCLIDIKYSVACFNGKDNEQVYCYSALIIYRIMIK